MEALFDSFLLSLQSVSLHNFPNPDDWKDVGKLLDVLGAFVLHWSVQCSCKVFRLFPVDSRLDAVWRTLSHWVRIWKLVDAPRLHAEWAPCFVDERHVTTEVVVHVELEGFAGLRVLGGICNNGGAELFLCRDAGHAGEGRGAVIGESEGRRRGRQKR